MAGGGEDDGSKALLRSRLRSVAFAALEAGVPEADLWTDLRTAVDADTRRRQARPRLHVVR